MAVMILEKVPVSLRGEITRWMLELKPGVFVGSVSALVRDKLWNKICEKKRDGGCVLVHSTNTEQGFVIRLWGDCSIEAVDFDGLTLIRIPRNTASTTP